MDNMKNIKELGLELIEDDKVKNVTFNIIIGDLSIGEVVKKIKDIQQGEKPAHLTDEQWIKWKNTGDQILKNVL